MSSSNPSKISEIPKDETSQIPLSKMRKNYGKFEGLNEHNVHAHPVCQFRLWLEEAKKCKEIEEANAMLVSTATPDGHPSCRTILLKGVDDTQGFLFFTNYESRKGKEIDLNPHVCLTFYWPPLQRQIHIEGIATKVEPSVSDAYFNERPFSSRIGALASPQSSIIESQDIINEKFNELNLKYSSQGQESHVPRPQHWGGYYVKATAVEFWQGGCARMHSRLKYIFQNDKSWKIVRLAP